MNNINFILIGRFKSFGGYTSYAHSMVRILDYLELRYLLIDINEGSVEGPSKGIKYYYNPLYNCLEFNDQSVVLIIDRPDNFNKFQISNALSIIGCTIFETNSIPAYFINYINDVDYLMATSEFNRVSFISSGIDKDKIYICPITSDPFYSSHKIKHNYEPYDKIKFTYILSNLNRKDPRLAAESFLKAFQDIENVQLILKTNHKHNLLDAIGLTEKDLHNLNEKIIVIGEYYSNSEIRELIKKTQFYFSTERAKGWDIPAHNAMLLGIPVISINSSFTGFLNNENAYLIPTKNEVHVDKDLVTNNKLYNFHYWADVSIDDVVSTLKKAYGEFYTENYKKKSENSIRTVSQYETKNIAKIFQEIIDDILSKEKKTEESLKIFI